MRSGGMQITGVCLSEILKKLCLVQRQLSKETGRYLLFYMLFRVCMSGIAP